MAVLITSPSGRMHEFPPTIHIIGVVGKRVHNNPTSNERPCPPPSSVLALIPRPPFPAIVSAVPHPNFRASGFFHAIITSSTSVGLLWRHIPVKVSFCIIV